MKQFLVAYNPRKMIAGRTSGDWEIVEALNKYDAINTLLNMPLPGYPSTSSMFDQSDYIYVLEVKPGDRTDLKK